MERKVHDGRIQGAIIDLHHQFRVTGYSSTIWLLPAHAIPQQVKKVDDLLHCPHETYDTPEEIAAAGWQQCEMPFYPIPEASKERETSAETVPEPECAASASAELVPETECAASAPESETSPETECEESALLTFLESMRPLAQLSPEMKAAIPPDIWEKAVAAEMAALAEKKLAALAAKLPGNLNPANPQHAQMLAAFEKQQPERAEGIYRAAGLLGARAQKHLPHHQPRWGTDGFGNRRGTVLATLNEIMLENPDGLTAKEIVALLTVRCRVRGIAYDGKTEKRNHFREKLIPRGYATFSGGVYKLTEKGRQAFQGG